MSIALWARVQALEARVEALEKEAPPAVQNPAPAPPTQAAEDVPRKKPRDPTCKRCGFSAPTIGLLRRHQMADHA